MEKIKIWTIKSGVLLLFLGFLTGIYVSSAMTLKIDVDSGMALASHLNAIMGAFVIFGLALSLPYLRYGVGGLKKLALVIIISNYANWFVTAIKAWYKVHAIDFIGNPANDVIFIFLTLLVVIPSLVGGFMWLIGFNKTAP